MAPVSIKYVVSFSAQADQHKVQNLISGDGFKKWLSHPKEKSGRIEAILQLEGFCQLAYIDIGSHWCANIELKVGRSDWPQSTLYRTLVSTSTLMTPEECKLGRHSVIKTRMFSTDNFVPEVAAQKWDRIQVICRQPYRKDIQFGLSFMRIRAVGSAAGIPDGPRLSLNQTGSSANKDDVTSIKAHFFGNKVNSSESPDPVKSRLIKLAGTSENGSEQDGALSRTARLVLAAAGTTPKYGSPFRNNNCSSKTSLFSDHLAQKYGPTVDEELLQFFEDLDPSEIDLDKITVADLRHKFEKKKRRKLTREEKQLFMERCSDHICNLFDAKGGDEALRLKSKDTKSPAVNQGKIVSGERTSQSKSCKRKLEVEEKPTRTLPSHSATKKTCSSYSVRTKHRNSVLSLDDSLCDENEITETEKPAKRFPFAPKDNDSAVELSTPLKRSRRVSSAKKQRQKPNTCDQWLSKTTGNSDVSLDTQDSDVARPNMTQRLASSTPSFSNYVHCSMCKGHVPERIFADHKIVCRGNENSKANQGSNDRLSVLTDSTEHDRTPFTDLTQEPEDVNFTECPLCADFFPADVIAQHADLCASALEGV